MFIAFAGDLFNQFLIVFLNEIRNIKTSQRIVRDWRSQNGAGQPGEAAAASEFVTDMFQRILSRSPSSTEEQICLDAIEQQRLILADAQHADPATAARESLVRALLNHNDFLTIR